MRVRIQRYSNIRMSENFFYDFGVDVLCEHCLAKERQRCRFFAFDFQSMYVYNMGGVSSKGNVYIERKFIEK
ncbi:hypothetical protein D3C74_44010 [compost metagenome]